MDKDAGNEVYRGRFQLIDSHTGQPEAGIPVRVRSSGGQCVECTTDAEGCTVWIESDVQEELSLERLDRQGSAPDPTALAAASLLLSLAAGLVLL